ncbi:NAD synthetase [Janibacter sp. Soil728]|uniref:NAD(+) synthase n=1 Tax=Janibacter sp. Soil728 TaxID=1736393 RepID=UPI0006F9BF71|nr:NAD(+) synthase [Janibacter sp. Soil728]KRE39293.1 NAD synthetase [Janibacter sp. Soil728]
MTDRDFRNLYRHGFARVAACTLPVTMADPFANAAAILERVRHVADQGAAIALFPELSLTGYAIDDLLLQDVLLRDVEAALIDLAEQTADLLPLVVVGAPLRHRNRLYNCAVLIHRGEVLGIAPKSYLPNYREFYEKRHFAAGAGIVDEWFRPTFAGGEAAEVLDGVPFGTDVLVHVDDVPGLVVHAEVCEDMWVPVPPSHEAALAGATVLLNLSASPITVARADDRHLLARSASMRCNAAYLYAAASEGESSTDLSWDGQTMVYEGGDLLGESERFPSGPRETLVDVDVDRLRQERMRQGSFDDNGVALGMGTDTAPYREVHLELDPPTGDLGLLRPLDRFPFVPDDEARLAQDCYEAYNIQVTALTQRLRAIGGPDWQPKIIIGVSGGLDSTHALLVAAKAMDRLERPRTDIIGITMPGFATSDRTKTNAVALMESLGLTWEELDIRPAATQMLRDMGHAYGLDPEADHPDEVYDVTFENVQAGLRTDYLFRIANQRGGIVLGTGDLSELALGWCTYGVGDQMSHYGVNAGVPKTLMQHLVHWVADTEQLPEVSQTLLSVLDTEISPELVPSKDADRPQSTQDKIGPYALQDFTLFHVLRRGDRPSKIAFLAEQTWSDATKGAWPASVSEEDRGAYDLAEIRKWLLVFVQRFFANQFKRSALPNGPKVLPGGAVSPRGDLRMPSDVAATRWLADIEEHVPTS